MSVAFCWFHSFMKIVFINAIEIVLFASKWINLHTAGQISLIFSFHAFSYYFPSPLRFVCPWISQKYKKQATDSGDVAVSDSFHYLSTRAFRVLFWVSVCVWVPREGPSRLHSPTVLHSHSNEHVVCHWTSELRIVYSKLQFRKLHFEAVLLQWEARPAGDSQLKITAAPINWWCLPYI